MLLALAFVAGCRKQPIKFTEKMAGEHTWRATVVNLWFGAPPPINTTFPGPIYVLNERTIVFPRAGDDTMHLLDADRKRKRLVFVSAYEPIRYGSYKYDTVIYDYVNNVIFYNSTGGSSGKTTWTRAQTP
ncbi:MAG: hypothetical protein KF744_12250 [Taibaiella sp.]|nr:hypothetical protein [Taibaiella sp.]